MRFLAFVILALSFWACQKSEITAPFVYNSINYPNGFAITGDGYSSLMINMNESNTLTGYYDTSLHITFIDTKGDTNSYHAEMLVKFIEIYPSTYLSTALDTLRSPDSIIIKINTASQNQVYSSVPKKSFLNISKYYDVNGRILGSFYGSFINLTNPKDTVIIADGRFSVMRLPDKY